MTAPELGPTLPDDMVPACGVCGRELLHPYSRSAGVCWYRDSEHSAARLADQPPAPRWIAARSRTVVLCTEHQNIADESGLCWRCGGTG